MQYDVYTGKMNFFRHILGTNPSDPNIHDSHVLDKQRKLILEKNQLNSQINKYLDAIPISKDKGDKELNLLFDKLENLTGYKLTSDERAAALAGNLDRLKETFAELDIKGVTVFFWNKEKNLPMIGSHMINGFLKASAESWGRCLKKKNGKVMYSASYTQSLINQHVRVDEEFLTFDKDIERKADGSPWYEQRSLRAVTAQGPRVSIAKSEVIKAPASTEFTLMVLKGSPLTEDKIRALFGYGFVCGIGQWRNSGRGRFNIELKKMTGSPLVNKDGSPTIWEPPGADYAF